MNLTMVLIAPPFAAGTTAVYLVEHLTRRIKWRALSQLPVSRSPYRSLNLSATGRP
jgi:hypothetical protein